MSNTHRSTWSFAAMAALWALAPWGPRDSGAAEPWPTLEAPLVVELFTSQSCSSCPPADKLLGELAKERHIIALGCHVTYWDHLNWRDTLSLPACTDRQRSYSQALGSGVYTPQMVVNGRSEFVGSDRNQAVRAILKNANAIAPIPISKDNGTFTAHLPALPDGNDTHQPLTLWFAVVSTDVTQAMRSGENRGRTITYTRPVKAFAPMGTWSGKSETRSLTRPPNLNDGERLTLIAQRGQAGPIVAAGVWP